MNYSIIIPSFNRIQEIKELMASVEDMQIPEEITMEVVIVDDGSTDSTMEFLSNMETNINLTLLTQANSGPGKARNLGMSKANGDYFIFIDSDCLVPSNYLTAVHRHINLNPCDAFGGPDSYHPSFPPLLKAINFSMTSFIGTGGTRGSKRSVGKFYPRSFNMGISRKVYESIGGFSTLRHGQDMDYSARIYNAGFKVELIPDAVVFHKRRTTLKKFFKQIFNWGVARINLSRKHKELLKPVHFLPSFVLLVVAMLIVFFLLGGGSPYPLMILGVLATIIGAYIFISSFFMYNHLKTSALSVITTYTQVIAYGLGLLWGLIQRYVLRKTISEGFTKRYYE